jgi:hypothetical protein
MLVSNTANHVASGLPTTTVKAITRRTRLGKAEKAQSKEKGLDERAHFPPGVGDWKMTCSPVGQEAPFDGERKPDREYGVQRQEGYDGFVGGGRQNMLGNDRAVAEAGTAPLARIGLAWTTLAVLWNRTRTAITSP